jgi:photosystem II stability/assembly factor-like uncharacterized protein
MTRRAGALLTLLGLASLTGGAGAVETKGTVDAKVFDGLKLRNIGPALMSGRVADIAVDPGNRSTWYVAVGSGNLWKTTNRGTTWESLFEDQPSYSLGAVAVDPKNPRVVWLGTGENVSGRHVSYGDGVYKSLDAGRTWTNVGLRRSEHIGDILIDPRDPNVVYVAAEGPLWSSGAERGVFKTTDGGKTWTHSLKISDETGVTALDLDPRDPAVLYAAAYQRRRSVWSLLAGGPESGLYKSTDAGATWRRLGEGLPKGDMGRIGVAVSPVDPDYVYATIEAGETERGFYRSKDRGESWEKRNDYVSNGTGPHYYQEIYASPHLRDRVYQMDVWMHVTEDGGKTFGRLGEPFKHSDNHALVFDPQDPEYLLAGTDGGLYETFDHGRSWRFLANLPVSQFYKMALDDARPFYNVLGGLQDNGTQLGPVRTDNVHGIRNEDWTVVFGADGYSCAIDPEDPETLYASWQNGNLLRYDKKTGELLEISPRPGATDPPERANWDAPLLISPHSHTRLYYGTQQLWRSDDRGSSWKPLGGDLSRGENRYALPMAGRVRSVDALYDQGAMSRYGNLTSIAESPLVEGLLYVGTDDGLIQVSEDGGASWRRVERPAGLPERVFVNDVRASLHEPDAAYAVLDNHKEGDYRPLVIQSTDRGRTWRSIAGDLPERHIVWSIVQDHVKKELLFVGTEFGIFFTLDGGMRWLKLSGGVPTISFRDLEIQRRENDLVGASFGRGFWVLDDYSPLRHVSAERLDAEALLFPVRTAPWYVPRAPLAMRDKAMQGAAYFTAPNPPHGAVFTYRLKKALLSAKEKRREREKPLEEKKQDVPFPGWDALKLEGREPEPAVVLTVKDAAGAIVRRITGPAKAGFHRVAWDLRYPPVDPISLDPPRDLEPWEDPPAGPLAPPGRYTVELAALEDGALRPLAGPEPFETRAIEAVAARPVDRAAVLRFQQETAELLRQAQGAAERAEEAAKRLEAARKALLLTPGADPKLMSRTRDLEQRLADLRERLTGDRTLGRFDEARPLPILQRVGSVAGGSWNTTQAPTETQKQSLAVARAQLGETNAALGKLIEEELPALDRDLEAAGAPYTPGRRLPGGSR